MQYHARWVDGRKLYAVQLLFSRNSTLMSCGKHTISSCVERYRNTQLSLSLSISLSLPFSLSSCVGPTWTNSSRGQYERSEWVHTVWYNNKTLSTTMK